MTTVNSRDIFLVALVYFLPTDSRIVEIGVLHGDFSKDLLGILNPKTLYLIDPYEVSCEMYSGGINMPTAYSTEEDYLGVIQRFEKDIERGRVVVERKYSYDAVDYHHDKSIDLVYLDGSHRRGDVRKDLRDWLPKLKDSGLMCGHDYILMEGFGVIEAVDEFCNEHSFEMILFNENGGDWALKKKL